MTNNQPKQLSFLDDLPETPFLPEETLYKVFRTRNGKKEFVCTTIDKERSEAMVWTLYSKEVRWGEETKATIMVVEGEVID